MNRETAERTLVNANENLGKLEGALKKHLGIDTNIQFQIKETRCGYYVVGIDTWNDVHLQMTATPLLSQLFKSACLRIQVWDAESEVVFGIAIDYSHNYMGGSNGHDLMAVGVNKETGEVIIKK